VIRVAYIAGEPSPWRAPHLDRIGAHPEIDLSVIYAATTVQRREWELELKHSPLVLSGPSIPAMRLLHHDYPLTPQIWRLLNRERFDVLVIGGWSLMATQLAIIWARTHGVPYLIVSENHLRENRPRWIEGVKRLVLPHVVPPAAGHLVTGTLSREHQLHYGARADAITVFPNTIDVEEYSRRAEELRERRAEIRRGLGIPEDAVAVTQVCRFIPFKGLDDAVEAVALAQKRVATSLHLLLVGSGPLRDELEARAAQLGVPVTFTGWRAGDALLEAYAATDIFMLLSRREPWGIVVNEAASFGLPLILTEGVGAGPDLLVPGENGELVVSGDIENAASAIARLASDASLRERYGRRSRELVAPWGFGPSVESFVDAVRRVTGAR
jgi:glycosyltransferase involved in cell wall biosynthesis